jgi:hypothetical protein
MDGVSGYEGVTWCMLLCGCDFSDVAIRVGEHNGIGAL